MPLSATRGLSLSGCPVSSLLLTPEALAQVGARSRLVVLKSTVSWKMAGGAWASIVLTSTLRRRRTPRRNRSIPTILAGRSDGGIAHVSAVDTGLLAGSTPRSLGGRAGCSQPRAGPTIRCPTLSDSCPGGPAAPTQHRLRPAPALSRPTPRGRGSTGRGLCVLHEGPTYPECPRPSSSGSRPSCSTGRAPSQRLRVAEPPRRRGASGQEGPVHPRRCREVPRHPAHWRGLRSGRPTGGLRCHGLRSSQVMRQLAGLSGTATRSGPSPRRGPRPRCPGPARHRAS